MTEEELDTLWECLHDYVNGMHTESDWYREMQKDYLIELVNPLYDFYRDDK